MIPLLAADGDVSESLLKWIAGALALAVTGEAAFIVRQAAQNRADLLVVAPFMAERNKVLDEIKPILERAVKILERLDERRP